VSASLQIRRAAVIGAGVMGAAIAAHLANAGVPALLLDVPPGELLPEEQRAGLRLDQREVRNRLARQGLRRALTAKPPAFFVPELAAQVATGNVEDDWARLAEVDWVIEAVVEDPLVKAGLFQRLDATLSPTALLSSNTSGLRCADLAQSLSPARRARFFITHFFNPPRYLHLLELVACPQTDPALLAAFADWAELRLGKGCVIAKDTPNFIANRIGTFAFMDALAALVERRASVAEIDALTGELIGRPKSATFRTADLVGLDTLQHVAAHLHAALRDDPARGRFEPPELLRSLVEQRRLGVKTGAGFYRRAPDGSIQMLDPVTLAYGPAPKADPRSLGPAAAQSDPVKRLAALVAPSSAAAAFLWPHVSAVLSYAADCVPEISDELVAVDAAMRWGFGWAAGPFQLWDALGVPSTVERLRSEGRPVPQLAAALLASGAQSFYRRDRNGPAVFSPATRAFVPVPSRPRTLDVEAQLALAGALESNPEASLLDLGEDVLGLLLHSRMNVIGEGVGAMLERALERLAGGDWKGLVIGGRGENLTGGANLKLILKLIGDARWDALAALVARFQQVNQALRASPRPAVVACRGLALGGGCELSLHAARVVAAAESYLGLVEVGAGVIPAGGGCKELVRRLDESLPSDFEGDLLPFVQRLFLTVGKAQVSGSAEQARALGFLGPRDPIVMNADQLWHAARQAVLDLDRDGWAPPWPRRDLRVMGQAGLAALEIGLWNLAEGRAISAHDALVGRRLATVLCGGAVSYGVRVGEQHLLDLEREAFLSLCGERKTQERMAALMTTGKPLRN